LLEGDSVPGRSLCSRKVALSPEGSSVAVGACGCWREILQQEGGFTQTGKAIPSSEGDNVRQTDATRKNACQ
ncbi:hypothetical protein, partial [Varibaculum sp.]|uniref:hypothetical protein n=1 Tax=Varibaculum sp. TaxID=1895474 RepID=UPI0025DA684E